MAALKNYHIYPGDFVTIVRRYVPRVQHYYNTINICDHVQACDNSINSPRTYDSVAFVLAIVDDMTRCKNGCHPDHAKQMILLYFPRLHVIG